MGLLDLQARQYTADCGFAYLASNGIFVDSDFLHNLRKIPKFPYTYDVEEIRSRHGEMWAKASVQFMAGFLHLRIENVGNLANALGMLGARKDVQLTNGMQPPHPVPTLVFTFKSPMVVHTPSLMH